MESNTLILCPKELFLLPEKQEAMGLGTSDEKLLCHFLRKNHSVSFFKRLPVDKKARDN